MAGLKDIADQVGVSIRTVSRALQNKGYVRAEVREQVLEAAGELNYRPNRIAQSLKTNRSFEIAVILSSMDELHLAKIAGLEQHLRAAGYSVTILMNLDASLTPDSPLLADVIARRPAAAAILGLGSEGTPAVNDSFQAAGIPSVVLGLTGDGFDGVGIDRQQGVYDAVSYLIEQGYAQIAYLATGIPDDIGNATRRTGYERALLERGRTPLLIATEGGPDQFSAGRQAVHGMLDQGGLPNAVQAYSDVMALGVLAGLRDRRLRVPDDLAVVGFDDRAAAAVAAPPLTTVAQPNHDVGAAAAEILLARIDGASAPADGWSRTLPTTLIKRESA